MLRHKRKESLEKKLNNVMTLTNLLQHSSKMSVEKECHGNIMKTLEDQPATYSVTTNVLVPRHSFQSSTVVHQEGNVTTYLENARFEGKVTTIKIMSRYKLQHCIFFKSSISQSMTSLLTKKNYNVIVSDYDIDLKKNYNVLVSDYGITDVYVNVTRTY